MGKITIFTQIKDEQLYLDEWIQYHLNLGIDKIYIMEDVTSSSHKDIVEKYGNKIQLFRLIDIYPREYIEQFLSQRLSFQWFVENYWGDTDDIDWCFFIDIDEFIEFDGDVDLRAFLDSYKNYPGVFVNWVCYNANGHLKRENGTVNELYKAPKAYFEYAFPINARKSCVNFKYPEKNTFYNVHRYNGAIVLPADTPIHLNHFITKSWEDWIIRLRRGNVTQSMRKIDTFFDWNPDLLEYKEECLKMLENENITSDKIYRYRMPDVHNISSDDLFDIKIINGNLADCHNNDVLPLLNTDKSHICLLSNAIEIPTNFKDEMNRIITLYPDSIILFRHNTFHKMEMPNQTEGIVYHAFANKTTTYLCGFILPMEHKEALLKTITPNNLWGTFLDNAIADIPKMPAIDIFPSPCKIVDIKKFGAKKNIVEKINASYLDNIHYAWKYTGAIHNLNELLNAVDMTDKKRGL